MGLQHVHWWKRWENDYLKTNIVLCFLWQLIWRSINSSMLCFCLCNIDSPRFVLVLQFNHLAGRLPGRLPNETMAFMPCLLDCKCSLHNFYFSPQRPSLFPLGTESLHLRCLPSLNFFFFLFACLHSSFDQIFSYSLRGNVKRDKSQTKPKKNDSRRLNYQQWSKRHRRKEKVTKKLRCYTIVFHNKPKKPLLHQAARRETRLKIFSFKAKRRWEKVIKNKILQSFKTFDARDLREGFRLTTDKTCTSTQHAQHTINIPFWPLTAVLFLPAAA